MSTILLSYAAGPSVHSANQRALVASGKRVGGFSRIDAKGPLAADHPLRIAHPEVFAVRRGAGCWIWKPQIILEALENSAPGDIVAYVDSGARLRRSLGPLCNLAGGHDAVLFANGHANAPHTKRDAYVVTGTDVAECHGATQLDAAFILWRNTEASRRLAALWLRACEDERALTDQPSVCGQPELPSFLSHRHDQSLLSLLVWRDRKDYRLAVLPGRVKHRFLQHHRRAVSWVPVSLWHATHGALWELRLARARRKDVANRRALGPLKGQPGSVKAGRRFS